MNILKQHKSKNRIGIISIISMIIIFIFIIIIIIIIVAIIAILLSIQTNEISNIKSNDLSSNTLSDLSSNTLSINPEEPDYIDCVGEWSDCSGNCESAIQTYKYIIKNNDKGLPCFSEIGETKEGQTKQCVKSDCPKDCVGGWSSCYPNSGNCGKGIKIFNILDQGNSDYNDQAKRCEAQHGETKECQADECPADCVSDWTGCSLECGPGIDTYIIYTKPAGNGKKCDPDIKDGTTITCLVKECNENLPTIPIEPPPPPPPAAPPAPRERCGVQGEYLKCDQGLPCCSNSGWCGSGAAWCNNGQPAYNYVPVSTNGSCGSTNGRKCFESAPCCSSSGWCGSCSDNAYGGSGNQRSYNYVRPTTPPERCGTGFGNSCGQGLPCCSASGWCGNGDAWCNNGQFQYDWFG